MESHDFLTVRKIARRNTRNRFILSGIFAILSAYFYVSVHVTLIQFILKPTEKSTVDPSYFVPGTAGGIFSVSADNSLYVNAVLRTFAFITLILFLYNITRAIMGAVNYKNSVTYRQLYGIMGNMEQNEQSINSELEKNQITSLPNFPKKKVLDNWTISKRFLKTRFSMNDVDEYKIYMADKGKWE